MIKRIEFENYRIFRRRQVLEIKPLVIVFGKNNSGKSAVIKLPVFVRSSFSNKSGEVIDPSFMGNNSEDDLKGLVYNKANKAIGISVEGDDGTRLEYSFFVDELKQPKTKIDSWLIERNGSVMSVHTGLDGEYHQGETNDPIAGLQFNGLVPSDELLGTPFKECINSLKYQIDYIGAFRKLPEAYPQLSTLTECSGLDGGKNYNHLIADSKTSEQILCKQVSQWYEDNFDGWGVYVNRDREPVYSIELRTKTLKSNISDTGIGIGQSMPVVIRACRKCKEPTLIILEEPETHLHPAAHANLAQLLAESAMKDQNKHYMIETHSINFILRIRRMVAEGLLNADDVALYCVVYDRVSSSSDLMKVELNSDGSVGNWPEGIFEETLQETIAIRKAQIKE